MISWQYLAGMIDGDGSIGTTRTGRKRNVVGRVIVANTDQRLLYALKDSFGGTVSIRDKGSKEGWKPFGSIAWTNRQAEKILDNTLPYLIVKAEQAEICLSLIRMRDISKKERYTYERVQTINLVNRSVMTLKPEIREIEEMYARQLNVLNKKGA
jgi:hypothetical protein